MMWWLLVVAIVLNTLSFWLFVFANRRRAREFSETIEDLIAHKAELIELETKLRNNLHRVARLDTLMGDEHRPIH